MAKKMSREKVLEKVANASITIESVLGTLQHLKIELMQARKELDKIPDAQDIT